MVSFSQTDDTRFRIQYLEDLTATSGYIEAKYARGVQWGLAGRLGFFEPGKLKDASGAEVFWDYPIKRYEIGVRYKVNRKVVIKFVARINRFDFTDRFDNELYAVQISTAF